MRQSISISVSRLESFLLAVCATVIIDCCASQPSYAEAVPQGPSIDVVSSHLSCTNITYQSEDHILTN